MPIFVCSCVRVCPTKYLRAGYCSTTFLPPTWRASSGNFWKLLQELIRCLVPQRKPLELLSMFSMKPCSSCYSGAVLKKLVVFLREVANGSGCTTSISRKLNLLIFSMDAASKTNVFAVQQTSLKPGHSRMGCG